MRPSITIVYNAPTPSRYDALGESRAVLAVLDEVEAVYAALTGVGYAVSRLPLSSSLESAGQELRHVKSDVVFNLFEGADGQPETEAALVHILDMLGKRYTGNPFGALMSCLDKARAKRILHAAGIRTPRAQVLNADSVSSFHLRLPCIVKPRGEDASHGLSEESVVYEGEALRRQVERVSNLYGGSALVEEFIDGREFNVTVLGNERLKVLPASEIVYDLPQDRPRMLTYRSKWDPEDPYYSATKPVCPADLTPPQRRKLARIASRAFKALGCRGYARVDMRLDADGVFNVLEVNPNPDISPGAGASIQAKAAGMDYPQFIERIVVLALEAQHQAPGAG